MKRKVVGAAGPKVLRPATKKIEPPVCSNCGGSVQLNSLGRLCSGRRHPIYHGCGRVLCSGRFCSWRER